MHWEKIWQLRFFRAATITIFYFMLFLGTAPAQEKEMSAETEAQSEKSSASEYTWHYAAVSVTLVSALMSYNASKSYNDLSAKTARWQHNMQTPAAVVNKLVTKVNMTATPVK